MPDHSDNHDTATAPASESRAAQTSEVSVNLAALVTDVVKFLVDSPDEVSVEELKQGAHNVVLNLTVAQKDVGKVIGKQGRTVRSLRNLVDAAAGKANMRATLEIIEDDEEDFDDNGSGNEAPDDENRGNR
jgi:predicted RNA-binding protein YlqC (UPF0109 family)